MNHRDILGMAKNISQFCMQLSKEHRSRCPLQPGPYDDFAYAEAILLWNSPSGTADDYYSTEDKFLLEFREELKEKFGLAILTRVEAAMRHGKTKIVTGSSSKGE